MKALVAIAAALALAAPTAASLDTGAGGRNAQLRLAAAKPISLRGSSFLVGEQVTVIAHSQGYVRSRTAVAGAGGRFLVRFGNMPFDRCQGFLAVARGARGSLARFKLPDRMCPPRL